MNVKDMIQVSIKSSDPSAWHGWNQFRSYYHQQGYDTDDLRVIEECLELWGAYSDPENRLSPYIYFRDQQSLVLFMLRWN